jgi:hypothetical protein
MVVYGQKKLHHILPKKIAISRGITMEARRGAANSPPANTVWITIIGSATASPPISKEIKEPLIKYISNRFKMGTINIPAKILYWVIFRIREYLIATP